MDTLEYWTPADALAFRCPPEVVGQLRPREMPFPSGERADVAEARLYATRAMRALMRIAEGDGKPALEAAKEILLRAYGPALQPSPAPALPEPQEAPEVWPPYITAQRHAYVTQGDDQLEHGALLDNEQAHRTHVDH